jgi:hypothetical protein
MLTISVGISLVFAMMTISLGNEISGVECIFRVLVMITGVLLTSVGMLRSHTNKKWIDIVPIFYGVIICAGALLLAKS